MIKIKLTKKKIEVETEIKYINFTVKEFNSKYNIRLISVDDVELVCDILEKNYLDVFYASYNLNDVKQALEAEKETLIQFKLMEYICIEGLYIVIC